MEQNGNNTQTESTLEFIDRSFEDLRYDKIRKVLYSDLKNCLKNFIRTELLNKTEQGKRDDAEIVFLRDEIAFLRGEMEEKNEVIKTLATKSSLRDDDEISHQKLDIVKNFVHNNLIKSPNCLDFHTPVLPNKSPPSLIYMDTPSSTLNVSEIVMQERELAIKESLNTQLKSIRINKHLSYVAQKNASMKVSECQQRLKSIAGYENYEKKERNYEKSTTCILGDSILKNIQGWKLSQSINNKQNVIVKSFSGATVNCMKAYVKPSLDKHPDKIILHVGTNDLKTALSPENIANGIVELALSINEKNICPIISGLIPHADQYDSKRSLVNEFLQRLCSVRNICFIDHCNIDKNLHLNKSMIHLNKLGSKVVLKNYSKHLQKL